MEVRIVKVLLIEDNAEDAAVIKKIFEENEVNFDLQHVTSLGEAYTALAESQPEVVFSNWSLPDGQGFELLGEDSSLVDLPLVLIADASDEYLVVRAMEAGAVDFVVKTEKSLAALPGISLRAIDKWDHILRKREVESALKKSEEYYRTTIDALADAVHVIDNSMRILLVNKRFRERLKEFEISEEPVGKNLIHLMPFLKGKRFEYYMKVFETGEAIIAHDEVKHGSDDVSEISMIPLKDNKGETTRIVTIMHEPSRRELESRKPDKSEKKEESPLPCIEGYEYKIGALKILTDMVKKNENIEEIREAVSQKMNKIIGDMG